MKKSFVTVVIVMALILLSACDLSKYDHRMYIGDYSKNDNWNYAVTFTCDYTETQLSECEKNGSYVVASYYSENTDLCFDVVVIPKYEEIAKTGLSAEKNYFKEISKNDDVIVINDIEVHTANVYEYEEENENITGKAYVFTTESEILAIVFYGNGVAAKEASENIINTLTIKNW